MSLNDDNYTHVVRNDATVEADQPVDRSVQQTQTNTTTSASTPTGVVAPPAANQSTVQTTTSRTDAAPQNASVARNVAETVYDPAAERAAAVDWVNRLVWLIAGVMAVLLVIRFALLAAGANESAGFAQLIYGLTGWMVAPFAGLFGSNLTYPGSAGTAVLEPEALVAAVVYLLVAFIITKLVQLAIGTNRTRGTVYSETDHKTKV